MIELIRRFDRKRFDVHVACFHKEGAWLPKVESHAPVTAFPIRGFARPATLARAAGFARWCRARRIAVVQTCDLYANSFALPAAALAGTPVRIGSRRELNPDKSSAHISLQRQAYRFAHAVVANSHAASAMLQREGLPASRVEVIPNGIDAHRFAPRASYGPINTVLTVANLRTEKAHEVLLQAAAALLRAHPHLQFQIAGDGPRLAELRQLASTLGITGRVVFLGHREDVPALLAHADAFVLPSRSEAFPNGVIEAMAAGLPVVASAVGGLLDLVEPGRTGLLVPPDDAQSLAEAIDGLVRAPARAAALGSAARDEVVRRYSFDRMVRSFEDLYLSQLEMPRRVSSRAA
jgi:glycosyltransferase involved in cell wall biosynthesis